MSKNRVTDGSVVKKLAGKDVLVYINYGEAATYDAPKWCLIGGQKSGDLSLTADSIKADSKDSGGWGEVLPGLKSSELDMELVATVGDEGVEQLKQAFLEGEAVDICRFATRSGTADRNFYSITEYSDSTPHDDVVTVKVKMNGKGAPKFYSELKTVDDVKAATTPRPGV